MAGNCSWNGCPLGAQMWFAYGLPCSTAEKLIQPPVLFCLLAGLDAI
jgi:hypothetical protein